VRHGNSLVKIGWSKREKRPYQHRVSRKSLDAVVAAVKRAGADGKVFTVDNVLPVTDPSDGAPVSDYLVYVGLAWLKQVGLVDQHGRQGYSIPKVEILTETVEAAWQQLPKG
jgi:exo-beta-1,3-glucanase (GH17 family)